ncbi:dipeptide ABC transporter ATP-binding protein [Cohnella thailandensis]|uniref:ABC transporter ATP-binding protein n=1 Tax=Cohnella thailandensis TaxID=557557 RepID=A0A841T4Z9_9BACL|nr:ABC transporter ATP-binding protein [Cohnella thailandensis]MBP1974078.1 peptide/nickel transport system ATP-binding protein [Cohnella thailandensis]
MERLLEINDLSVDFHTRRGLLRALSEVSLTIRRGETVCLVGESGSGKTITSKAVMRLLDYENGRIAGGRIRLDGLDLTALSQNELRSLRGKKMAMVFQEPMAAFDPVYTIGYQLVETIRRHETRSKKEAWEHAVSLLARVGIPEPRIRMKQYPGELSGGMLQRAMIALALSCGPELLIADEPTTALDVTIQAQILQLLQELKEEFRMSILLITHDLGIAAEIADRVVVLYAGRVAEQAPAAELFARPHHPYTRGLLDSVAALDTEKGEKLRSIAGSIPSLSALPDGCLFHPRCPFASDKCRNEAPPLISRNGRAAACWHTDKLLTATNAEKGSARQEIELLSEKLILAEKNPSASPFESPEASPDLFQVSGLRKFYRLKGSLPGRARAHIRAVDDVSFAIRRGETFGLVGESGSGKSTLGRVLLQLEKATAGRIRFGDRELTGLRGAALREVRKDMQMIFQDPYGSLDPRWNVGDIIGEPLRVHERLTASEKKERVARLLESVGLDASYANRYPHEFSGGQRQRIGIARAIALSPKFVLADEAVSALDVSVQAQVVNLLQELQEKLGLTYLFIAHGLQVVRHLSDRIGVMYLGKLVEIAPSRELFLRPAHPYTKALIASIPSADIGAKRERIALQGEIPSPARPPSGCRFHTRCPLATARCKEEEPELRTIGSEHVAACHYPL